MIYLILVGGLVGLLACGWTIGLKAMDTAIVARDEEG